MINKLVSKISNISKDSFDSQLGTILFIFGYNAIILAILILVSQGVRMGIGKFNILPEGPLSRLVFNLIVYSIFGLEALVVSAIHALYLSKNILYSRYKIHKTKSNIKNIIFMFICLIIAIIINSILFSGADNNHLIFQLLVFYIVQSVAYYLLLKVKWFKT